MLSPEQLDQLDRVFNAQSIAVVGAGEVPGKVGYNIVEALLFGGYRGRVYPVHPRLEHVLGLKTYPSVRDLPEPIDLAIIAINQFATVEVLADCAAQGAKGIVSIAGGFREMGPEGEKLEEELIRKAEDCNLMLIGPNTLGFLNPSLGLNTSFYPMPLKAGSVAILSQSGGVGLTLIYRAFDEELGLSKWIGCGNRSTLAFSDYLQYLAWDPQTRVIGVFMEGAEDAAQVARLAREVVREKPIVLYKIGRTQAVNFAALTHTGSMAGSYRVYRDVMEQAGIVIVDGVDELISACKALALCPPPPAEGVGILTHTAGPTIVAFDELAQRGCNVPPWQEGTVKKIKELIADPPTVIKNPLDLPGAGFDAVTYGKVAETLLADEGVGSLLAVFTHNRCWRYPDTELAALRHRQGKPVAAVYVSSQAGVAEARRWLQERGVPVYTDGKAAGQGLAALYRYKRAKEAAGQATEAFDPGPWLRPDLAERAARQEWLTETEAKALLAEMGVPVPAWREASDEEEAVAAAREIGFPVVLKVLSPEIIHKSDLGGVRLNLATSEAVREAFRRVMERARTVDPEARATVQEMAAPGTEVIVGIATDPHFGRVLMFGLGGVFAEVLEDVVFALPPLSRREARALPEKIRARKVLAGYRGRPPADLEALADLVWRVGQLAAANPCLAEMDLNPVVVYPQGLKVLDARIRLAQ
ncbi:MAG: acetate--CoA ligase family protein [Clostridia bacterium]|nr:acetate--CoA ligase family protein [Clostridia bacterium]MDH7572878.1 acetate--CoA ligase family protein [Clostridia bacterium]